MAASRVNNIINSMINGTPYNKIPLSRMEAQLLRAEQSGGGGEMKKIVCDVLPTENIDVNALYLTPSRTPGYEDYYAEYTYINNKWEKLGETPNGTGISYDNLEGKPGDIDKSYINSLFD